MKYDTYTLQRAEKKRRTWHRLLLLGPVLLLVCATLCASADDDDKPLRNPARFVLHSKEPFQAVHVPFVLRDGDIIFQATLSGKTMECDLDTGSSNIFWDGRLALPGRITGGIGYGIDGAGQTIPGGLEVILPAIHIGDYELQEAPGFAVTSRVADRPVIQFLQHTTLIGSAAFTPIVLTIDYQKKELIMREPAYDFSRQPRGEHDLVFDLAPKPLREDGKIVLRGRMGNKPARIVLDTGWDGPAIGLTAAFREKIRSSLNKENPAAKSEKESADMLGGEVELEQIPQVAFSLGDKQPIVLKRPALITAELCADADAAIGPDILRYFRVTIDFPRKKLLLEPYRPDLIEYTNPDPSLTELIIKDTSYWIPKGSFINIMGDSVTVKPPKLGTEPKPQ